MIESTTAASTGHDMDLGWLAMCLSVSCQAFNGAAAAMLPQSCEMVLTALCMIP